MLVCSMNTKYKKQAAILSTSDNFLYLYAATQTSNNIIDTNIARRKISISFIFIVLKIRCRFYWAVKILSVVTLFAVKNPASS